MSSHLLLQEQHVHDCLPGRNLRCLPMQIAFSSIKVALQLYQEDLKADRLTMHYGVIKKRPGSHPADPTAFELQDHITTSPADHPHISRL